MALRAAIEAAESAGGDDALLEPMRGELAKLEKSGAHAKEAADICSAIVRKNIGYKDVRVRRKEVDELIRTLG